MLDGILLLDKPPGITSHDLVDEVRKVFRQKRVGHTGILDPLATGLMVILLGRGTLLSAELTGADKKYSAIISFGKATGSFDSEGKTISEADPGEFDVERFEQLRQSFVGSINQLIPPYSAAKVNGRRMYQAARRGDHQAERRKAVDIYSIELTSNDWPDIAMDIHCSSGTYVRSLAHEMGQQLGCGGYLKSLVRTGIGRFSLDQAITLETLKVEAGSGDEAPVIPLCEALPDKPKIDIKPEYCRSVLEGKPFIKRYLSGTDYKGPGGCLSLLLGPGSKVLAIANLNYNWGSFERLDGRDILGKYVRIIDEGHIRQKRA